MKQRASDVEPDVPILRWRDRPPGGDADEDRAAALTRDALGSGAFPAGLDDRELAALEARLGTGRRARPPFWLRPAIVAALVSISVASVMGYETGWFAPLRARLRFRAIPPAVPTPAAPPKAHAPRRALESASPTAAPPLPAPVAPPAPVTASVSEAPARKLALTAPPRPERLPADRNEPTAASQEIAALEQAVSLLRGKHDAPAALAALDRYIARFPDGTLAREARVARVDALLMLHRDDDALRALDELPLDAHRRSTELQLIRGELRARTDCARAEADFTAVLARVPAGPLEERALYGRAACRSTRGNTRGAGDDLRRYVDRFPNGTHAGWARRWLESNP